MGSLRISWTITIETTQEKIENAEPLTAGIIHRWPWVCKGQTMQRLIPMEVSISLMKPNTTDEQT